MFAEATKTPSHPAQGSSRLSRAGAESPQTPRRRKNSSASRYRNFCRRYRKLLIQRYAIHIDISKPYGFNDNPKYVANLIY